MKPPALLFAFLVPAFIATLPPAAAGAPEAARGRPEFRPEIVSPGGIRIISARATHWGGRMIVGGSVEKKFGFGDFANSHLDVIVLGEDGEALSTIPTNYFPRPIPANYRGRVGRATYAESLPSVPSPRAKIRVFHHQSPIKECRQATAGRRATIVAAAD